MPGTNPVVAIYANYRRSSRTDRGAFGAGAATAPAELAIRIIVAGDRTRTSAALTKLKAEILPKMLATRVGQILFFADGKQVCNVLDPIAAECEWDAGAEVRPHVLRVVGNLIGGGRIVASSTHQGPRSSREGVGRRRAGHRGRHRSRAIRLRPAAAGVPAARRRRAADDRPLLVGRIAARDRRRDRRQREHDAGDAAAEELGEEVPGARSAPKDQVTVAAFNDNMFTLTKRETSAQQRTRADRSPLRLGRHRALRRDHSRRAAAVEAAGPARARGVQRRRRSHQPRDHSRRRTGGARQRRDAVHGGARTRREGSAAQVRASNGWSS